MKAEFFKCECGCGGLHVAYDPIFGLELAHLVRDPYQSGWRHRLAAAWAALRGRPYQDMVILNRAQMADLIDCLKKAQEETQDERYAEVIDQVERVFFGVHCETAVDAVLKWADGHDCSRHARERLKSSL